METAARWHAQLEAGTADTDAFEAWRAADPGHAVAFARIAGVAGQFDRARAYLPPPETTPVRRRYPIRLVGGLAAGLGLGGALAFGVLTLSGAHKLSTPVGAERTIVLPDGTNLVLNTDTAVSWKFDEGRRRLWIQRGEIAVTVHADSRPLVIYGGKGVIQLSQGKVNARLRSQTIDLAVLNGTARATEAGAASPVTGVWVPAGQGVLIAPRNVHVRALSNDDLQFISGWPNGELVLNGQTLGTVVQEYNRYLAHPIVVADPSLDGVRLGGRFSTRDPDRFLKALETGFDIHAARADDGAIDLSK